MSGCSAIWDLQDYCQKKQAQHQKLGIHGRWQVTPDSLEPPQKRVKSAEIEMNGVIEMKVSLMSYQNIIHFHSIAQEQSSN